MPLPGAQLESLAEILPPDTLVFYQQPSNRVGNVGFEQTVLHAIGRNPEMAAFLEDLSAQRQRFVNLAAARGKLDPKLVDAILQGQFSFALLDLREGGDGGIEAPVIMSVRLDQPPDQKTVFQAIEAIFSQIKHGQKMPGGIKLNIVGQEAPIGGHDVMRIINKTPLRFVLLGDTILFYMAASRDGLAKILGNYNNRLAARRSRAAHEPHLYQYKPRLYAPWSTAACT
jgi:hypothetical protein